MSSFNLQQLTEGIQDRHMKEESKRLCEKWSKTGLLRGLSGQTRETMSRLLENQAAQLLRESAALSSGGGALTTSGQIRGFSNVAFPIVRRVFGSLIASELVSIQPMSLPSGLLFYLDYTYGGHVGGEGSATDSLYTRGASVYNNPVGKGVRSGSLATGGQYDLVGHGFSKVHSGSNSVSGTNVYVGAWTGASEAWTTGGVVRSSSDMSGSNIRMAQFDPDVMRDVAENTLDYTFVFIAVSALASAISTGDPQHVKLITVTSWGTDGGAVAWGERYNPGTGVMNLLRLNERGDWDGSVFTPNPINGSHIKLVARLSNGGAVPTIGSANVRMSMAVSDILNVGTTEGDSLTIPSFETDFGTPPSPAIPEIDIKVESIAVTATTRKLRARWSPELAQDLNAYHSLDAEVELTKILSEHISLDIDREVLNDLLTEAGGANFYWSRAPGKFVDKTTGRQQDLSTTLATGPSFTGTVREWYETLVETIIDVANQIGRKTLRGSANFVVTSPDVCTILEQSAMYKTSYKIDGQGQVSSPMSLGAESVGSVSNRFTVYKDNYFPRNKVLVGFKGGNYLESGYVYAPYVPLIVTPTIFRPDDFAPTKGVMTRYAKKMIRSDFFGTVTVLDLNII